MSDMPEWLTQMRSLAIRNSLALPHYTEHDCRKVAAALEAELLDKLKHPVPHRDDRAQIWEAMNQLSKIELRMGKISKWEGGHSGNLRK